MADRKHSETNVLPLRTKNIVLGITGSIAAYKAPELIRALRAMGADVRCILTENGARFVTPLTLQTLSCNMVYDGMFDPVVWDIQHISLSRKADVVVVAPATADAIARFADGRADDLLSSVVLATRSPILICPAMNENMWTHPATQENVRRLKKFGYRFVAPEKGELACGVVGGGRLAALDSILQRIVSLVIGDRRKTSL
jgi:phosphopantothenoylcysteine synthetase/decarboxylase